MHNPGSIILHGGKEPLLLNNHPVLAEQLVDLTCCALAHLVNVPTLPRRHEVDVALLVIHGLPCILHLSR